MESGRSSEWSLIEVPLYIDVLVTPFSTPMQVNTNGPLSFRSPFTDFSPRPFPLISENDILIAPFWDDIFIIRAGEIYYRFSVDPSLLEEVGGNISDAFSTSFIPSQLFVATWDRVAAIGGLNNLVPK